MPDAAAPPPVIPRELVATQAVPFAVAVRTLPNEPVDDELSAKRPVRRMSPETVRVADGEVVPMPTLPLLKMAENPVPEPSTLTPIPVPAVSISIMLPVASACCWFRSMRMAESVIEPEVSVTLEVTEKIEPLFV